MKAVLPANEAQRLATLRNYAVLDSLPEQTFDDLTLLAAHICKTPIALVSLIDEDRQWFKSKIGLSAAETSRDFAFCAHAILYSNKVLEVHDAQLDPRFSDNPLVTSDPNIRFYAGAPLVAPDGSALGTLCVIDSEPRTLDEAQIQALQALSRHVVTLLEMRRSLREQKQAEKERDRLFNYALDMYCIVGFDGNFKQLNPAWEKTLGWKVADMVGKNYLEFIHPDDHELSKNAKHSVESGKDLLLFDNRYLCKDGSYKWFSWVAYPDADEGLIFAVARDVSKSKLEEERFRSVVEASPSGMVMVNETGMITLVNGQAEQLFGYTRQELIGQLIEVLLPEGFRAAHPKHRSNFFAEPKVRVMGAGRDLFGRRKDGSEFPLEIGLSPMVTPEGRVVLAVVADITARKQAEQLLHSKNEELKGFAYTVSHDLKAPLRGIVGYAQEMLRRHKEGLSERAQFCIDQIITASTNLDHLIEDLLKYSRLDTDTPTPAEVDLPDMVQSILRDRNLAINELGVELSVNIPPLTLHIWERGLHQVLTNLIDNAIKYSRKSQPPRLTISAAVADGRCRITVADNGIGFDMKYHDRIFGLFNRLVRPDEFEGTGVGLAIVKKLIEKLGGTVRAEAKVGEGATFFVELPK